MFRTALLLTCLLAPLTAFASESDAQVAKAEQLAAGSKYEDAINILEDMSTTVIGDPAVIKASELTQKYYPQWCDALKKTAPQFCKALARFKAKQSQAADSYGFKEKFQKALEEWENDLKKQKAYQPLIDFAGQAAAALGDDGKTWQKALYQRILTAEESETNPANFLMHMELFAAALPDVLADLPADMKKKAATAFLQAGEKLLQPTDAEKMLQSCDSAEKLNVAELSARVDALRLKAMKAIAKYYETMHETELAKAWLSAAAAKTTDAKAVAELQKSVEALSAAEAQYEKIKVLPAEITKATTIKALPVPYTIEGNVLVKSTGSVIVEHGTCIKDGSIMLQNTSLTLKGTKESPIVLEDVDIGNALDPRGAKVTVTAEYVVFVRSSLKHFENWLYGNTHKWTVKNCIFIGPSELIFYDTYVYDITNCDFKNFKLSLCKAILKPNDFVTGPTALNVSDSSIDPRVLWSINKCNYTNCQLMTDEKYALKLHKIFTQRSAWFDPASRSLLDWKTWLGPDEQSTGKAELVPVADKNPGCGADWVTLKFAKP